MYRKAAVKAREIFHKHRSTFMKFCFIGGISTIINYGIFYILLSILTVHYLISSASGYIAGVAFGFTFNKSFTFRSREDYKGEAARYLTVYAASLIIGLAFLKSLVFFGLNALIANALTIGLTTMTNYLGSSLFVFKRK